MFNDLIDKNYKEYWVEGSFGLFVGNIFPNFEELSFAEQKQAFFYLLKKLLDDKKIVIFPPQEFLPHKDECTHWRTPIKVYAEPDIGYGKSYTIIWNENTDKKIAYIKKLFPKEAKHENDTILHEFWYGYNRYEKTPCPNIGWIDPDNGYIHSS
jgi:hypothetical protein